MIDLPLLSDLPGRPGEQMALHRAIKALVAENEAQSDRIDELGRVAEQQADKIRWLEGELSRVAAIVQGMAEDARRERHYRQTGTLPAKQPAAKVVSSLVGDVLTEGDARNSRSLHLDVSREAAIREVQQSMVSESADGEPCGQRPDFHAQSVIPGSGQV